VSAVRNSAKPLNVSYTPKPKKKDQIVSPRLRKCKTVSELIQMYTNPWTY